MQTFKFKDLGIISTRFPSNNNTWIETNSSGIIYIVDSVDETKIYKTINKCSTWSEIEDRANDIKILFYDTVNDYIYGIESDGNCFYIDLSDDSIMEVGDINGNNGWGADFAADIFVYNGTVYGVLFELDPGIASEIQVFKWVDPNWVYQDAVAGSLAMSGFYSYTIVAQSKMWITIYKGTGSSSILGFNLGTDTFDAEHNIEAANSNPPFNTQENRRFIAYDDSNLLYFIILDTSDSKYYLYTYSITGNSSTKLAEYNISLMLDRNNRAIVPSELEKGFSIGAKETVYEIKARRGGVRVLQDMSDITDAVIIAITDNFLMNKDGDMFEFTDVTNEISTIRYNDGIIGIQKKGVFTVHPDFQANWSKKDSIKIYDDNDVLEFHGIINDKNRNSRGIYVFKIDSFTNEIYRATYEKNYSGDDTDTKQKDIIDNGLDFNYRSSSIVGTTTNYDYKYNRAIVYLFWLGRFLERQVPYIEPDGKIWTKAHDGLVATGKSWDINDNSQEVFLIDIPGIEERIQGFFDGNSGVTRNTVRYKNNALTVRPVAATRDPIEQLQGILPLNEFRDPKLEAATEANQLGDNRYNIWSSDIIFLGLRIEGQGYLQPGKTIEIQNTGEIAITQDDFLILSFERDPKNDVYISMVLSDNIIFPREFNNLQDTTITQVHTASVQAIENQGDVTTNTTDVAVLNALNMIGSANAAYVPCMFETNNVGDLRLFVATVGKFLCRMQAATYVFALPLPSTKGDYKLYITKVKIGLSDADGNDYIDSVTIWGVDHNNPDNLYSDPTNRITSGSHVSTFPGAIDCSAYEVIRAELLTFYSSDDHLDLNYVAIECYYDT